MSKVMRAESTLSIPKLSGIIVVYLAIIQVSNLLLTADQGYTYAMFPTTEALIRAITIPVGLSVLFAISVISWLGWWGRVLRERNRLGRWAWVIPVLMVLSILVVTNYPLLGKVGSIMVLTLLATVLLVGIGEELMYRGIVLEAIRGVKGITELKAALWTALIFGGSHITNVFTEGSAAFFQVAITAIIGLYFYVALRVSGTLLVPIILHAGWDFSLFSGNLGVDPKPYDLIIIAMLTNIVLAVIVVVRRRAIWPR